MVRKGLMDIVMLSGIRKELLLYLYDGPRSLSEIREQFDITSPEVSPRIKELLEHDLIKFDNKKYHMTPMGKVIIKKFKPFIQTINIFDQYCVWWKDHDLTSIPNEFLCRIDELNDYFIIEDDASNANKTREEMDKILNNSSKLYGITCTFIDTYPDLFLNVAMNKIQTSIIITDNIYNTIEKKHIDQLKKFNNLSNADIYVTKDEIKISLIVTDTCIFLALTYNNGRFDLQSNLVSYNPSSVKWGVDLFEYYRKRSARIS